MLNDGCILDGKYEVIKTLGQGGMSTVYLCKNIRLGNLWAIKEVKKELKGQMDFLAEPNMLKNLNHPGIPRVVDIFYEEDNLYIVEDYIEGETLQDYIKKSSFIECDKICRIAISTCEIIEYLHSFNPPIIYRDLKPSNIMITPSDKIILIDFGISRVYKQGGDKDTVYMGSKGYAAPEQYGIEQTCRQTDIYGLGAVIYFMVSRKAPGALLEPLKNDSYSADVNGQLKKIIQKAMQIDIEGRYSSVEEMKEQLIICSAEEYETKTLLMQNPIDYSKTLTVDSSGNIVNDKEYINLAEERVIKARFTDKCKSKDLYESINEDIHNEEEKIATKNVLHQGMINFHKVNSTDSKVEIKNKKIGLEDKNIELNNDELKINNNKSGEKEEVANKGPKKANNRFDKGYNELKSNTNKRKKNFIQKLAGVLVCVLIIGGLYYLVAAHEETKQIMNSESTNTPVNDEVKTEDNNTKNENSEDNKGNNNTTQPATKQATINNPSSENLPVNNTVNPQNNMNNSIVSDKNLKDKKEIKPKNNGKAKGKHKYDENDQ